MGSRVVVIILSLILTFSASSGAENRGQSVDTPAVSVTKESMIREVEDIIKEDVYVLSSVSEIKQRKDKDGKDVYVYLDGTKETPLEDLDIQTLQTILERLSTEAGKIQEAFRRQEIETAEEAQKRPPLPPPGPPPRR